MSKRHFNNWVRWALCSSICFGPLLVFAQVINDSIDNRIELKLEAGYFSSSTTGCTIEWKCVEQKQLKNSITFHNDQWFYFTTRDTANYYLNIRNQQCKKQLGLQVLIIEGEPCVTSSYKYLNIYPVNSINDLVFPMKGLDANKTYLVSIDGLLGDLCDFEIKVTKNRSELMLLTPIGDPEATAELDKQVITLSWRHPNTSPVSTYLVIKKIGKQPFKTIETIKVKSFSHLNQDQFLEAKDTLNLSGDYEFQVIGLTDSVKYLILSHKFNFFPSKILNLKNTFTYESTFDNNGILTFTVFDYYKNNILFTKGFKNKKSEKYNIDLSGYEKQAIRKFKIKVSNSKYRNGELEYIFQIPSL
jgi:hypothetical protein